MLYVSVICGKVVNFNNSFKVIYNSDCKMWYFVEKKLVVYFYISLQKGMFSFSCCWKTCHTSPKLIFALLCLKKKYPFRIWSVFKIGWQAHSMWSINTSDKLSSLLSYYSLYKKYISCILTLVKFWVWYNLNMVVEPPFFFSFVLILVKHTCFLFHFYQYAL